MSKFILYDWRCTECNTKFDALAKMDDLTIECPQCGADSKRLISAPTFNLGDGKDPDFPTAYDAWEKKNKQKVKQDKKFYDDHGVDKKHHSYGS